jgi:DNA-binding CsgD family transcriptional regulator
MINLSHRQKQVLALLADGFTDKEIGVSLGISPRTARAHVEALKLKLGVPQRRQIPRAFRRLTGKDPLQNGGAL